MAEYIEEEWHLILPELHACTAQITTMHNKGFKAIFVSIAAFIWKLHGAMQ